MEQNKEQNISRRYLREKTLQILYAVELSNDDLELLFTEILSDIQNQPAKLFIRDLTLKTISKSDEFDDMIKKHTANWEIGRLAIIDKILIRMALTEIIFFPEIPPKVSINEAIEIAKRYSTEQSDRFINGILDHIYHELLETNQIVKKGRGLINSNSSNLN